MKHGTMLNVEFDECVFGLNPHAIISMSRCIYLHSRRIEGSVTGQSDADSCLPHNLLKSQIIFEKIKL
jgi:hypothetical protein